MPKDKKKAEVVVRLSGHEELIRQIERFTKSLHPALEKLEERVARLERASAPQKFRGAGRALDELRGKKIEGAEVPPLPGDCVPCPAEDLMGALKRQAQSGREGKR